MLNIRQIRYNQQGVEIMTTNARNNTNPVTYKGERVSRVSGQLD